MASLQFHLLYTMMRYRHLLQGKLSRQWDGDAVAFRDICEKGAGKAPMPAGVTVQPVTIPGLPGGLKAEWLIPDQEKAGQAIFYTHGGGYISGSCSDHRALVAKVAKISGIRVLLYEYRLAPEHPFPAGMHDTLTAYRWFLAQGYDPQNTLIAGESAGGGLCLAALLAFRDEGLPLPSAAVAISPWTDLKLTGESYRTRVKQAVGPEGMDKLCSEYYCGQNDPGHPWISPLYGDLRGLPPMFISVGDWETMRDDAIRYAHKAKECGVEVTLRAGDQMIHCYPLLAGLFPEATAALDEINAFIQQHIGQKRMVEPAPAR